MFSNRLFYHDCRICLGSIFFKYALVQFFSCWLLSLFSTCLLFLITCIYSHIYCLLLALFSTCLPTFFSSFIRSLSFFLPTPLASTPQTYFLSHIESKYDGECCFFRWGRSTVGEGEKGNV